MQQQSALTQLALAFNLAPASYIDPSWLPRDWAPRFEPLSARMHPRTANALSRWLLQQHALADQFDFDFEAKPKRLVLLDREALQRLAFYLGVSIYARILRAVVERAARAALVQRIGADAYEFALHKAPVDAADRSAPPIDASASALRTQLLIAGASRLLMALGPAPALQRRAQLKLPRATADLPAQATPAQADATRQRLIGHLIPEVTPQWTWLF